MSIIEQLTKRFEHLSDLPHVLVTERQELPVWNENGKPFEWQLAETDGEHHVYVDSGYGWIALFKNDQLVDATLNHVITSETAVVLDREYYSTTKYIWK